MFESVRWNEIRHAINKLLCVEHFMTQQGLKAFAGPASVERICDTIEDGEEIELCWAVDDDGIVDVSFYSDTPLYLSVMWSRHDEWILTVHRWGIAEVDPIDTFEQYAELVADQVSVPALTIGMHTASLPIDEAMAYKVMLYMATEFKKLLKIP